MLPGDHEPSASFGWRLRRLREQTGLSQRDLAIAVGVTLHMVYRWERWGVLPTAPRLARLAAALDVAPDALLGPPAPDGKARPAGSAGAVVPTTPPSLRALREGAGLSQWRLAVRLGVTEGTVRRWEAGDRQPNARYLVDLAGLIAGGSLATVLAALAAPPAPRGPDPAARPGAP